MPLTGGCACRPDAADPLLDAVLLHCLNHCAKAADRVKSGNERLKAGDGTGADPPRDQGFTRPKVRIRFPVLNMVPHSCRADCRYHHFCAECEQRSSSIQHPRTHAR